MNTKCCTYFCAGVHYKKSKKLFYNALGGGMNMDAEILSCLDNFSESIIVDDAIEIIVISKKCSSETAAMISLWKCSSSDILKKTEISELFSITVTIVGVERKAIKRIKNIFATFFIVTKIYKKCLKKIHATLIFINN